MEFTNTRNAIDTLRTNALRLAAVGVLAGTALVGCSGDTDPQATEGASQGTVETESPASVAPETQDPSLVLPGDDITIAKEAKDGVFKCGAERNPSVWNVDFTPSLLNKPENKDLLASKTEVLQSKIGTNATEILAAEAYANPNASAIYENHSDVYTQLLSRAVPVVMNEQAREANPTRENFMCIDVNTEANNTVGDKSTFRDIRSNPEGTTLLAANVSPQTWEKMVAAAYAEGIDIYGELITQLDNITITNEKGDIETVGVVQVFFEDDNCANQVFKRKVPVQPPTPSTPITPDKPNVTVPPTTLGNKVPTGTTPRGGAGSGGSGQDADPSEDSPKNGYDPASELAVDPDGDGLHNEVDACDDAAETYNGFQDNDGCPDVAPATTLPDGVVTGTAPDVTNAPVTASTNPGITQPAVQQSTVPTVVIPADID